MLGFGDDAFEGLTQIYSQLFCISQDLIFVLVFITF